MIKTKKLYALILGGLLATGIGTGLTTSDFQSVKAVESVTYTEITSVEDLYVGATYVMSGLKESVTHVMSITQESNNRSSEIATLLEGKIVETSTIQKFRLVEGNKIGTYGFKAINGDTSGQYLYAASSSLNRLRSEDELSDNSSWLISFTNGNLSVRAQGSNTNNVLRFNGDEDPPLFSCYSSGQSPIALHIDETSIPAVTFKDFDRVEINTDHAQTSFFVGYEFNSDNIIVIAYDSDGNYKIITTYDIDLANGYTFLDSDKGSFKVSVSVTLNGVSKTGSYYLEIRSARLFAKVVAQTRIKVDKVYALATPGGAASTNFITSSSEVDITYDETNNTFKEIPLLQTFKLEPGISNGTYALKLLNGSNMNKYYGWSSGTALRLEDVITINSSWFITLTNGVMKIANALDQDRIIVHNEELSSFEADTTGISATLYEATNLDIVILDAFVTKYMYPKTATNTDCTGSCITKEYYETVKKAFNALSATQRRLFVIDEEYRVPYNKLNTWAIVNGEGLNTLTNIFGPPPSGSQNGDSNGLNEGNTVMLIVIIALISVSVLGGAFYLRKREKS